MSGLAERIAAAPITWGVCEVPGWGRQIPAERFLDDLRELGLHATELGPEGFFPTDPARLTDLLAAYEVRVIAGFVPAVLHRPELVDDQLRYVRRAAATLSGVDADVMVLGPDAAEAGYESRIHMSEDEWAAFLKGLVEVRHVADAAGLEVALHPHWGMVIETSEHIERLLDESDVALCLDTGHLALAGADPVATARLAGDRIRHVHLKDLDAALAARVRGGDLGYRDGVARGLYRPLGEGDLGIAGVVEELESRGYEGWYVLEQDAVLEDTDAADGLAAARASYEFLIEITDPQGRSERSRESRRTETEGGSRSSGPPERRRAT